MQRILVLLTVALLTVAVVVATAAPALADAQHSKGKSQCGKVPQCVKRG